MSKNIGEKQATNTRPVQSNGSVLNGQTRLLNPSRIPTLSSSPVEHTNDVVFVGERYALYDERARGGLGRILEARDLRLDRTVAVKELLGRGEEAEARFVREALITARLQHPAIIPLYDFGQSPTGKPFYAMKMVEGRSLAEVVKSKRTMAERLELLPNIIAVADAIAYAHGRGVIHRDLKPSNVLIGPFGETVVIDWGLAADLSEGTHDIAPMMGSHVMPSSGLTVAGTVMGTPEYMPLEQAEGKIVDERADVYAIGAIIYYVLSGVAPYKGNSSSEVLTALTRKHPVPLEEKEKTVPQELATIVRKAMSRISQERYPTARELAEDLKRFQTGQLVTAHNYSTLSLVRRWISRHRAPVSVAVLFLFAMLGMGVISFHRIVREKHLAEEARVIAVRARNAADQQRLDAEKSSSKLILAQARTFLERDPTATLAWLKRYPSTATDWTTVLDTALDARSRGVSRYLFGTSKFAKIAFSVDGTLFATAGSDRHIRVWGVTTGQSHASLPYDGEILFLRLSPDSTRLAFSNWNGPVIYLWDLSTNHLAYLRGHRGAITGLQFSPDGSLASCSTDGTVRLWSAEGEHSTILYKHDAPVTDVVFSSDGTLVASASKDATVRLYHLSTGKLRILREHSHSVRFVQFSPNGKVLASAGIDSDLVLWNLITGKNIKLRGHTDVINKIVFSPNGTFLGTASHDKSVRLWDLQTNNSQVLIGHTAAVYTMSFSPDGKYLASGGRDSTIRLWDTSLGITARVLTGHRSALYEVLFSPDGRYLASASSDRTARLWDLTNTSTILRAHTMDVETVAFSPDGKILASASADKTVRLWDLQKGGSRVLRGHKDLVHSIAFAPGGKHLASSATDGTIRLWDTATGESCRLPGIGDTVFAFGRSGVLASAGRDGMIRRWQTNCEPLEIMEAQGNDVVTLSYSPDESMLASADRDGVVRLWTIKTGQSQTLYRHTDLVTSVAFSSDGRFLASSSWDKTIRLWSIANAASNVLLGHTAHVTSVMFLPDGLQLLSASEDHTLRSWHIHSGTSKVFAGHVDQIRHFTLSPSGTLVASGSLDSTVRLWNLDRGDIQGVFRHDDSVMDLAFSPDGQQLASASVDNTVRLWMVADLARPPSQPTQLNVWIHGLTNATVDSDGISLK